MTLSWQKRKKSKRISYDCRDLETQVKPLKARKVKPANILPNRAILSTLYDKFTTNVQIVHSTLNSRANYCTRYPLCRTNLLLLLYTQCIGQYTTVLITFTWTHYVGQIYQWYSTVYCSMYIVQYTTGLITVPCIHCVGQNYHWCCMVQYTTGLITLPCTRCVL